MSLNSVFGRDARVIVSREGLLAWLPSLQRGYKAGPKIKEKRRMSSRVLRKLQGDKDLEISHVDDEDEDELNFTSVKSKKKQKAVVNPFNLVSTNCIPRNTGWLATRNVLRLYLVHFKHLSLSLYVVLFVPLWEFF